MIALPGFHHQRESAAFSDNMPSRFKTPPPGWPKRESQPGKTEFRSSVDQFFQHLHNRL
jgi:hypothetical protein